MARTVAQTGARRASLLVRCIFVAAGILFPALAQAQGTPYVSAKIQLFDNNGDPCASCHLFTYSAGASTPLATYSDSTLTTANANPIVLDSAGRASVFFSANSYKLVLKNSSEVTTYWTIDGVGSIGLIGNGVGFELSTFGGDPNVPIVLTSLPSGTTADKTHAGTLLWTFNSSNIPVGTYGLEAMMLASGGTVTASLVNLSDGSPDTPMVSVSSSSATGERQVSSGITFPAGGSSKVFAVKVKVSAGYGLVWLIRIVRIS